MLLYHTLLLLLLFLPSKHLLSLAAMLLAYCRFITLPLLQAVSRADALSSTRIVRHGLIAIASIVLWPFFPVLTSSYALSAWFHALSFTDKNLPHALATVGSMVVAALSCFFQSPSLRASLYSRQPFSLPTSML